MQPSIRTRVRAVERNGHLCPKSSRSGLLRDYLCHDLGREVLACVSQEAAEGTELAAALGIRLMLGGRTESHGEAGNDILRCRPLAHGTAGGRGDFDDAPTIHVAHRLDMADEFTSHIEQGTSNGLRLKTGFPGEIADIHEVLVLEQPHGRVQDGADPCSTRCPPLRLLMA
jgi:hypothetical protein